MLIGGAALSASPTPLLQLLRWTEAGSEIDTAATQPSVCLAFHGRDKATVHAGMALFNTPTLLGGQAAKAGLSCASCHVNGRDNPHFLLPSLSSAAGTADVTSSFFSAARGNGVHDPVRIPDLARPGKVSRDSSDKALERFIRNLIVEEFSGNEPAPATLSAVSNYVRAIGPCAGGDNTPQNRHVQDQIDLIDAALDGASLRQQTGDSQTVNLLIASARHQLGLISERYAGKHFATERRLLLDASRRLAAIANAGAESAIAPSVETWRRAFGRKIVPRLIAGEQRSLYSKDRITAAVSSSSAAAK